MLKKTLLLLIVLNSISINSQIDNPDLEKRYKDLLVKVDSLGKKVKDKYTKEYKYINERLVSLKEQKDILSKHKNNKQTSSYINAKKQIGILIKEADSCIISLSEKLKKLKQVQKKKNDTLIIKISEKKKADSLEINADLKNKTPKLNELDKDRIDSSVADKTLNEEVFKLKKSIEDLKKYNANLNAILIGKNKELGTKSSQIETQKDKLKYWVFAIILLFFIITSVLLLMYFQKKSALSKKPPLKTVALDFRLDPKGHNTHFES